MPTWNIVDRGSFPDMVNPVLDVAENTILSLILSKVKDWHTGHKVTATKPMFGIWTITYLVQWSS